MFLKAFTTLMTVFQCSLSFRSFPRLPIRLKPQQVTSFLTQRFQGTTKEIIDSEAKAIEVKARDVVVPLEK
jgi:hypothetical protein